VLEVVLETPKFRTILLTGNKILYSVDCVDTENMQTAHQKPTPWSPIILLE
jgi:hypothetical protein